MGDEVEELSLPDRLREAARIAENNFDDDHTILREAADTIESLRSSLTRVEEERDHWQTQSRESDKARVEANKQWRLDYNAVAQERDELLTRLSRPVVPEGDADDR